MGKFHIINWTKYCTKIWWYMVVNAVRQWNVSSFRWRSEAVVWHAPSCHQGAHIAWEAHYKRHVEGLCLSTRPLYLHLLIYLFIRARGGGGAGGASAPPPHFFGNFKELLRKRCFQPPHFESLGSPPPPPPPPTFKVARRALFMY